MESTPPPADDPSAGASPRPRKPIRQAAPISGNNRSSTGSTTAAPAIPAPPPPSSAKDGKPAKRSRPADDRPRHPLGYVALLLWLGGLAVLGVAVVAFLFAFVVDLFSGSRSRFRPGFARFTWIAVLVQAGAIVALVMTMFPAAAADAEMARRSSVLSTFKRDLSTWTILETSANDGTPPAGLEFGTIYSLTDRTQDFEEVVGLASFASVDIPPHHVFVRLDEGNEWTIFLRMPTDNGASIFRMQGSTLERIDSDPGLPADPTPMPQYEVVRERLEERAASTPQPYQDPFAGILGILTTPTWTLFSPLF